MVDSGLRRASAYDPAVGMAALVTRPISIAAPLSTPPIPRCLPPQVTRPISIAAADQRAGRAGRVAPGTAYRLWSEDEHRRLEPQAAPEI